MKRNVNTKLRSADAQTKRFGLGMLSPTVVILLIMTAYPLFFTLVYSFTDYNSLKGTENASYRPSKLYKAAERPVFPAIHSQHRQVHYSCCDL